VVEIHVQSNPRRQTAPKLEMSNRDNSAANCPNSLKFGMRKHALWTLRAHDESRELLIGTGTLSGNYVANC